MVGVEIMECMGRVTDVDDGDVRRRRKVCWIWDAGILGMDQATKVWKDGWRVAFVL